MIILMITKAVKIIISPYALMVSILTAWLYLVYYVALRFYFLWMRIATWFLNCILSLILIWLFGLTNVTITIGEFGFLSVKGVKIQWRRDDPGLTIEEVELKKLEWNLEKVSLRESLRDLTLLFNIKNLKRELFTDFKDATTDIYTSFTLHWKMHSVGDLLSSDLRNSSETIPKSFTLLKATDGEIGSRLHIQRGGSYVILLEAAVLDGLMIPSEKVTSFYLKARDVTYYSGPYDSKLNQARREKIIELPLLDVLSTFYLDGPSRITMTCHEAQMFLCPSKINSLLIFLNHLLRQQIKPDLKSGALVSKSIKVNMEKFLEVNIKSNHSKASICFQDGTEAVSLFASFSLSLFKRKTKSQYTASAAIQSFVPGGVQTRDPCVIIGNELISAPWECTFAGSEWSGHSTLLRVTSEQTFSLILRPDCIPVFRDLHEDYTSILDKTQVDSLITLLKAKNEGQSSTPTEQIFVNCRGLKVFLEMDVYEELLNISLEDLQAEFNRDLHHVTLEFDVQDVEVEDCINKIIAFQRQRSCDDSSPFLLRFSLLQDAVGEEDRVVIKRLRTELGNSKVSIQEIVILKLLQFAGIKDRSQLWSADTATQESEQSRGSLPAFLTSTRYYFEKLQVGSFQTVVTCNPANKLPNELQSLKSTLEIPAGFPPLMENADIQFREFLRTKITYKALVSLGRDTRTHYLKEIGAQSASLLGSLHLLGNLSSLQGDIAEGLADLKETGDYIGFVKHVRGGLAESYYKFADSWSATLTQSAARRENSPSSTDSASVSDSSLPMKSVRGVVESLASFILSPSRDATVEKLQLSNSPPASPTNSPRTQLTSRRLLPVDSEDQDSSGSEESSLSCIQSLDGWEMVSKDVQRKQKGQEFLRRLQVSLCGETNGDERFVSCLKLRHLNPEDKLNALVTNQNVYFMRVGSPSADHVVLSTKLMHLYKSRHRHQDDNHYLQLLMKISGGKRLSLPSPNPADSPLVRCDNAKVAQKAANIINQTKRNSEENISR